MERSCAANCPLEKTILLPHKLCSSCQVVNNQGNYVFSGVSRIAVQTDLFLEHCMHAV